MPQLASMVVIFEYILQSSVVLYRYAMVFIPQVGPDHHSYTLYHPHRIQTPEGDKIYIL